MLAGDGLQGLDTNTFNLDQLVDYAIIPTDTVATPVTNSESDFDGSPTVSWSSNQLHIRSVHDLSSAGSSFGAALAPTNIWAPADGRFPGRPVPPFVVSDYRSSLAESLDSNAAFVIGEPAIGAVVELALNRTDASVSKLWGTNAAAGGALINIGLQPVAGESTTSALTPPDVPSVASRVDDFLPRFETVEISIPVDTWRPSDDAPWLVIAPTAPVHSIISIGHSDAQIDVGQVIDELLTAGNGVVDQALPEGPESTASDGVLLSGNSNSPQTDGRFPVPVESQGAPIAASPAPNDEGGMIPVQGLVDRLAGGPVATPSSVEVVADDIPAEISGELARVAIMELIEGQSDPTMPDSAATHNYLVAIDDVNFTLERTAPASRAESSATLAAIRVMADQAGLAASFVGPVNPVHLAALASAASDAFAASAMSAPLLATSTARMARDDARAEAFSQWDDAAPLRSNDEESGRGSYGFLVGALAVERLVATRRKQKRNAAAAPPLPVR